MRSSSRRAAAAAVAELGSEDLAYQDRSRFCCQRPTAVEMVSLGGRGRGENGGAEYGDMGWGLTGHETVAEVVLAVGVVFDVFPFEVGAAAAVAGWLVRWIDGGELGGIGTGCLLCGHRLRDPWLIRVVGEVW